MDLQSLQSSQATVLTIPILVALVTAVLGSMKLIVDKENKISDYRHEWLNSVREIASRLVSNISVLAWSANVMEDAAERASRIDSDIKSVKAGDKDADISMLLTMRDQSIERLFANQEVSRKAIYDLHHDWALLQTYCRAESKFLDDLRPKINAAFSSIREFNGLKLVSDAPRRKEISDQLVAISDEVPAIIQPLIKEVWSEIKKGELSYRVAKCISYAVSAIALGAVFFVYFSATPMSANRSNLRECHVSNITNVYSQLPSDRTVKPANRDGCTTKKETVEK